VSWGPLVEYSAKQSKIKKVASRLGRLFSHSSSAETRLREIIDDLRKELLRVRRVVYREQNLMKHTGASKRSRDMKAKSDQLALLSKRKRLMYLFVRDLSSGICGEVLANKAQRDALSHLESPTTRVSAIAQVIGWLFVFFMNIGMLIYVYLFAMTQTQSRQSAWFQSFVMWIIFEIFVSSTGLVVFFHLLVPLYVFTEVSKIKEKVLLDLISFRENYLRRFTTKESAEAGDQDLTPKVSEFNAAKYLFASWRVASLFPELPESQLVLQFSTPWPKKKFGDDASEVSREYDPAVILTSLSRVLLFFIASLLRYHMLVQDIIVQLVCNSGFAFLILLFIRAARIHPLLSVAFVLALFLAVFLLLRCTMSRGNKEMLNTLKGNDQSVQPSPSPPPHDEEVKPLENDSSQSSLPRPHHPHVILPANQETQPSSHEERSERQIAFASGDEEDGRQIEWEEDDEDDDELESVFVEDEKSRWGGMSGSSSSRSSSFQDSQVSAEDWLQLVAAAVGEFWKEDELSVE
jgi:hypothetical protein